jgi:predicted transcriptional regulator
MQTKQTVQQILDRLPDDCTIDDVLYHLYVVRSVERGLAEADAGKTIPHEQVVEDLRKRWLVGDVG